MDAVDNKVGQTAEGKVLNFVDESHIKPSELKCFEHPSPGQFIKTVTHEFSAVCPFSGLPDLATVIIEYFPIAGQAVELKSLKYYLLSYRNVGIYQEGVTRKIFTDFKAAIGLENALPSLCKLRVTTHYHVRGGFYTTCTEGDMNMETPKISYPENF